MKTIELFAGTKSFSKVADALGHSTFTVELEKNFAPDLCADILNVSAKDLPGDVDVLWASPPCTSFSVAAIGSNWIGNFCPKRVETALGMAYVLQTLKIIKQVNPKFWFIENPRGCLRKMEFMKNLPIRRTITYCKYGDTRMKPTDIWTNCESWTPRPMCKNGDPCHESAPRGSKTGTQGLKGAAIRSMIPPALFYEIFEHISKYGN